MPETQTPNKIPDGYIRVKGPDNKIYPMPKGTTKDQASAYFKRKGINAPAKKTEPDKYDPSKNPAERANQTLGSMTKHSRDAANYVGNQYANAGGIVGSMAGAEGGKWGATVGSAIGGGVGEALNQLQKRLLFSEPGTNKESVNKILMEGVEQGALQKGGELLGSAFFKILSKIPTAEIKNGIPLLPSDLGKGGRVSKMLEDFMSNFPTSAKTMATFKKDQSGKIIKAAETLANGMSKFRGNTEQMGELIQTSIKAADKQLYSSLRTQFGSTKDFERSQVFADFQHAFREGLLGNIQKARGGEFVGGLIRAKGTATEDVRSLVGILTERAPAKLAAAKTRILKDVLTESVEGHIDPVVKDGQFTGKAFTDKLDSIGHEKLKAFYTKEEYKGIKEFADLTKKVSGESSSLIGKLAGVAFILWPIKGSLTVKGAEKLAGEAIGFNRLAKIITTPDGIKAIEGFIRATGGNTPRAAKVAFDIYKTHVENADRENEEDDKKMREEYNKEHGIKTKENK